VGADGTLQVTPYYKPAYPGRPRPHFKAVADAVGCPSWCTNVPGRTGLTFCLKRWSACVRCPVVGIKEATGSAQRAAQIIARVGDRMVVLSGDDATAFPLYALGAQGCISVVSNVAPADMAAMWDAAAAGKLEQGARAALPRLPAFGRIVHRGQPDSGESGAGHEGKISDEIRAPLYPMAGVNREKVRKILADLKLI